MHVNMYGLSLSLCVRMLAPLNNLVFSVGTGNSSGMYHVIHTLWVDSTQCLHTLYDRSKGSFGSHHLGLESKNLFMILANTCLAATELVMAFISNSMTFHFMPNLNTYWVPCHFYGFSKWNDIIISLHFISTKWNEMMGAKRALRGNDFVETKLTHFWCSTFQYYGVKSHLCWFWAA
jgi:hypothetical protein